MRQTLLTLAAIALFAGPALAQDATQTPPAVDTAAGLAQWSEKLFPVFAHPRCANCHVDDDRPRWSGAHYGPEPRTHAFNAQRGHDGSGFGNPGLRCTSCHFESNSKVLHGPPGAHNWHLAPVEMAWFGKSSKQICEQIKDPARNGGRDFEALANHIRDDKLVAWGWDPGPGREPAPFSADETFRALQAWTAAGAPCPPDS